MLGDQSWLGVFDATTDMLDNYGPLSYTQRCCSTNYILDNSTFSDEFNFKLTIYVLWNEKAL